MTDKITQPTSEKGNMVITEINLKFIKKSSLLTYVKKASKINKLIIKSYKFQTDEQKNVNVHFKQVATT